MRYLHENNWLAVLVAVAVPLLAVTAYAQAYTGLPAEERSRIEVVRNASRGVVHIDAHSMMEAKFEKHAMDRATGSGFVLDREGRVLTAFHVIQGRNEVDVVLGSGERLAARIVGTAPQLDLALLQVDADQADLFPLTLGDSDLLEVGRTVIAIGNPMGLHNTVTVGVVSAVRRSVEDTPIELQNALIQTDAAINPGNSGGPLLNSAGEVVGVNDAQIAGAQNLGFAIPINFTKRVVPDLIEMGHPYRPQLGFSVSEITSSLTRLFGLPLDRGLLVEEVLPFSPASMVGLRAGTRVVVISEKPYVLGGDIITAVNGTPVSAPSQVAHALLYAQPGQELRLQVYREGQYIEIAIPLQKMAMQF